MYISSGAAAVLGMEEFSVAGPMGHRRLKNNLSIEALIALVEQVWPDDPGFTFSVIPCNSVNARSESRTRQLTALESERVIRLATMVAIAQQGGASLQEMADFLARPHPALGDEAPRDLVHKNSAARDIVLDLVGRQTWGLSKTTQ